MLPNKFSDEDREHFATMSICILSPMQHIEPLWVRSTVNMMAYSWHHNLRIYEMAITVREVVDWARNNLARAALEKFCDYTEEVYTHVLWLDTDHVFNADLACQLARHMVDPQIDAVSALYYSRSERILPVAYVKDGAPSEFSHYPIIEVPNCLCEVDAVGFGALLMKRDVFEKVPEPWFTIDFRAGEDVAFCARSRKFGVRWFLDGQYKLAHLGDPQLVTEATYRQYVADNYETYKDRVKVSLGGFHHGRSV